MIMDNRKKVIEELAKNPEGLKAGQVADLTGVDKKEVESIFNELKKEDLLVSPKRCFWTVKK